MNTSIVETIQKAFADELQTEWYNGVEQELNGCMTDEQLRREDERERTRDLNSTLHRGYQ